MPKGKHNLRPLFKRSVAGQHTRSMRPSNYWQLEAIVRSVFIVFGPFLVAFLPLIYMLVAGVGSRRWQADLNQ